MNKYIKAWKRHDETRFIEYIEAVKWWTETMNASALFPYQVYENYKSGEVSVAEAQWKNLPDYGWHGSILPVIDVSGSMSGRPMSISISLWVYLSEKIKWPFQNAIISFEWKPKLHELKGNIVDRFIQCERSADDMSTNLQGVFDLLLSVAIRDRIAQADMPDKLLIISDMEFNNCNNISNFELIESRYRSSGYKMPYIVFWNVNGRSGNVPVTSMQYAGLISGTSPSIIQGILEDSINTPIDLMKKTLDSERYSVI